MTIINVADLVDPTDPQKRTFRQINQSMSHTVSIGSLVELKQGERLYVVKHLRDCDGTPLYSLSIHHYFDCDGGGEMDRYAQTRMILGHYAQESFVVIRRQE